MHIAIYNSYVNCFFVWFGLEPRFVPVNGDLTIEEEKLFLNSSIEHFRNMKCGIIIPSTANSIFRCYPDGAEAAPYGSYIIDLNNTQEDLWRKIQKRCRQSINRAKREGVYSETGLDQIETAYNIIKNNLKKSKRSFMKYQLFKRYIYGLDKYWPCYCWVF